MKTRWLSAVLMGALISACAAHSYRIEAKQVVLILRKPEAKKVELFCSLDGFKPRTAKYVSGLWEVVLPAEEGFKYFYHVDATPFLPDCPMKEKDDFGSENCIFEPQL